MRGLSSPALRLGLAASLSFLLAASTHAVDMGRWSGNGPFGADGFGGMAAGLSAGREVLYVATQAAVVKSTNGGTTWQATGVGGAYAIACDASGRVVYAACGDTVYRSADEGETWTATSLNHMCRAIAIDPASPDTVYASGQNPYPVLMKTTDGGTTWRDISAGLSYREVTDIEPVSAWPGSLVVCAKGLFLSQDGGGSWTQLGTLPDVDRVAVHPTKPNIMYVRSNYAGLWKTTTGGRAWKALSAEGHVAAGLGEFCLDPSAPNTLYAAFGREGFCRSKDGGKSWKLLAPPPAWNVMQDPVLVSPLDHRTVYTHIGNALWKSTNLGKTWEATSLSAGTTSCVASGPAGGEVVYAAADGVFKSTDRGASWGYAGLTGCGIAVIGVSPSSPDIVYACGYSKWYKTTDGGSKWIQLTVPPGLTYALHHQVFVAPGSPERVYISTWEGTVVSSDGGVTWTTLPLGALSSSSSVDVSSIAVDPTDPNLLMAAINQVGVARSTDGGASWLLTSMRLGSNVYVVADPQQAGTFYVAAGGMYATTDRGLSWHYLGAPEAAMTSLLADGARPGRFFATVCENCGWDVGGIYESDDAGITWGRISDHVGGQQGGALTLTGSRLLGLAKPNGYWGVYGSVLFTDLEP